MSATDVPDMLEGTKPARVGGEHGAHHAPTCVNTIKAVLVMTLG